MSDRDTARLVRTWDTTYWRGGVQSCELWQVKRPSGSVRGYVLVSCAPAPRYEVNERGHWVEKPRLQTMAYECDEDGTVTDWNELLSADARLFGVEVMAELGLEVA